MFLTVKLLLGRRCSVQVSGQESVATLKKLVSRQLQVPEEQQHLLFRGQLLADDKCLSDYCIGPNASINVIVRPLETTALETAHQAQAQAQAQAQPLWHQLERVLARHFGPQDAKAVQQLLRQEHEGHLRRVSLQDLEQLAQCLLAEQWCAESWPQGSCNKEEQEEEEKEKEKEEAAAEEAEAEAAADQ